MTTQYERLLSAARFRQSSVGDRGIEVEAESDRGRLLFCAAFRRLQQKAQVFSMEPNAAVRSRLTHSLEVSQMGRYIADLVKAKLTDAGLATEKEGSALVTFVETACLMHDIGNPPFGHFGEAAISAWFKSEGVKALISACGAGVPEGSIGTRDPRVKRALADFVEFDGNPQGLRVVAKLQRNSDEYGLNLTKTTLASFLKYVRSTDTAAARAEHFTKKPGFFQTEAAHVQQVWEEFGYTSPQRFPLAYIMEAADDLAYCISDLEDSIEKGLLSKDTALSEILDQWKETAAGKSDSTTLKISEILKNAAEGKNHRGDPFTYTDFRTSLNRAIAEFSADRYVSNHDAILQGTFPPLLAGDTAPGTILELLKGYCRKHVYSAESVQRVELAGYSAILGLLSHCQCLLEASFDRFSKSLDFGNTKDSSGAAIVIEKKLLKLFPKNYLLVYRHEVGKLNQAGEDFPFDEWQLRAHLVTDFLSGMTDDFAMTTFRNLSGMRL